VFWGSAKKPRTLGYSFLFLFLFASRCVNSNPTDPRSRVGTTVGSVEHIAEETRDNDSHYHAPRGTLSRIKGFFQATCAEAANPV